LLLLPLPLLLGTMTEPSQLVSLHDELHTCGAWHAFEAEVQPFSQWLSRVHVATDECDAHPMGLCAVSLASCCASYTCMYACNCDFELLALSSVQSAHHTL
jgi:hypothetical protein